LRHNAEYIGSILLLSINHIPNVPTLISITSALVGIVLSCIVGYYHILKILKIKKDEE
jgi:hypothetical protein